MKDGSIDLKIGLRVGKRKGNGSSAFNETLAGVTVNMGGFFRNYVDS